MTTTLKVCICILIGWVCLLTNTQLTANTINTRPTVDLFDNIHTGADKIRFVEDATYFTLNKQALAQIYQQKLETMTLHIPFGASKKLEVNLQKTTVLADDFKVIVQNGETHNTLSYSPSLFYRGTILGVEDALVTINFSKEAMTGVLSLNGDNYNIGHYGNKESNTFVVYKERNLNASNPFACSTEDPTDLIFDRNTNLSGGRSNKTVKVYVECDFDLYKANGSSAQQTTDFATALFNVISAIYENDDIDVKLGELKIWTTQDPYPTSSAKAARDAFGTALNGQFNGDIAHLLSNYKINGTVPNGGSANIDALCDKKKAVGYTNITTGFSSYPTYSWTAYAVTHEIGHNLGSPHTHSCFWPKGPIDNCWCPEGDCEVGDEPSSTGGTVMSYCHLNPQWTNDCDLSAANPGIDLIAGFGELPGELIRNNISKASCLGGGGVVLNFQASTRVKNEDCYQQNGSVTLTVSYGQSPYDYKWNTGATSKDLNNLSAGEYICTITDASGKMTIAKGSVIGSEPFEINAGPDQIINCAEPIATLDGSDSPSSSAHKYQWENIDGAIYGNTTKSIISVSEAGRYVLSILNSTTGCESKDTVEVMEQLTGPSFNIESEHLSCDQAAATIGVITSIPIIAYQWTGPNNFTSTDAKPSVGMEGKYTLIATGENGCATEKSIEVEKIIELPNVTAQGGVISCKKPSIQLSAVASGTVVYHWTGPNGFQSSDQNPLVEFPGVYHLTVSTSNGCTKETNAVVSADHVTPEVTSQDGTISCNNPTYQLHAITSTQVTYKWTGPNNFSSTEPRPNVSLPGQYDLVVTAENGCTAETQVLIISDEMPPFVTAEGGTLSCENSTAKLSANAPNSAAYLWNGPNGFTSMEQNPTVRNAGVYSLTVTSANGCTATTNVMVHSETEAPYLKVKGGDLNCSYPTVTFFVDTQSENLTYQWTGPNNFSSSEKTPSVNLAGIYQLLIQSPGGCTAIATAEVTKDFSRPSIAIQGDNLTCAKETVMLKGLSNDDISDYTWTNNNRVIGASQEQEIIAPGAYHLTVKTENGCTATETYTVLENKNLPEFELKANDIDCMNPTSQLNVVYDQEDLRFNWHGPNNFNSNLSNPVVANSGTYFLEVLNENGCSHKDSITIQQVTPSTIEFAELPTISCNEKVVTIDASASTLTENVLVEWTTADGHIIHQINELMITVDEAGTYALTVRDLNTECVTIKEVIIEGTPEVAARIENDKNLSCQRTNLMLFGNGGKYTEHTIFRWSTDQGSIVSNASARDIMVDAPGFYTLFVTDTLTGCSDATFTRVTEAARIEAQVATPEMISCKQPTTLLNGTNSTLNASAKIQWAKDGKVIPNSNTLFLRVNSAGTYTMTVMDTLNQCQTSAEMQVSAHALPAVQISNLEQDACAKGEGSIALYVTAESATEITWSNGEIGNRIENLSAGTYRATVTDGIGCQVVISQTIQETLPVALGDVTISPIVCHDSEDGQIEVELKGGHFPYETQWSNGETALSVIGLTKGTHTLEVVDAKGCVRTFDFEMAAPNALEATVKVMETDVMVEVIGGVPDYQYTWSDGTMEHFALNLSPGVHEVTIHDANGCSISKSFEIDGTTPIGEVSKELEIMAFPNPTTNYFRVKKDLKQNGNVELSVFSANGQPMLATSMVTSGVDAMIHTEDWKAGNYYLQIKTEEGVFVSKLVVVKL